MLSPTAERRDHATSANSRSAPGQGAAHGSDGPNGPIRMATILPVAFGFGSVGCPAKGFPRLEMFDAASALAAGKVARMA